MEIQIIPLIIVAAYLVGMLLVGLIVGKLKIKDSSDYMLAGLAAAGTLSPRRCPANS